MTARRIRESTATMVTIDSWLRVYAEVRRAKPPATRDVRTLGSTSPSDL